MYSSVCDGRYDSKVMPKSPIVAMIPAVFVGVLFPMCECVIIPIVRRLIQRVTTSCRHCYFTECTHYESSCSFIYCICVSKNDYVVYARFGITILVALFIGLIVYYCYRERNVLKDVEVSVQTSNKRVGKML